MYANNGNIDGGESNIKKEQNGRESMRRLKPIVGCNASKRRSRLKFVSSYFFKLTYEDSIIKNKNITLK
jgi:hypothetical protein